MKKKKERPTRDELNRLYWDEGMLANEIAEKYSVSKPSVGKWLEKYGIEKRGREDTDKIMADRRSKDIGSERHKPKRNWKLKGYFRNEMKKMIKSLGHFPSSRELFSFNPTLAISAYRYHGGLSRVAESFGYESVYIGKSRKWIAARGRIKPARYWRDFENLLSEIKIFMKENNMEDFPTEIDLRKRGGAQIVQAVHEYHGGFLTLYKKVGYSRRYKKWESLEYGLNMALDLLEKNCWTDLPNDKILRQSDRTDLVNAIYKHYGGFLEFRRRLNERLGRTNKIETTEHFMEFLNQDPTALNLATTALVLNGEATDVEQLISSVYEDRFKDKQQVHAFLQANRDEVHELAKSGLTNLGSYLGEFSLNDRSIIPVLLGNALNALADGKITVSLEDKVLRILRSSYGPCFNSEPERTLADLEQKASESSGRLQNIYHRLNGHYHETLSLREELG